MGGMRRGKEHRNCNFIPMPRTSRQSLVFYVYLSRITYRVRGGYHHVIM